MRPVEVGHYRTAVLSAVIALLLSVTAHAQELIEVPKPSGRDISGRLFLYGSVAGDLASTEYALKVGACNGRYVHCVSERNPLSPSSFPGRLAMSVSYAVGTDLLAWACERAGHPTMAHRFRMFSATPKIVWTVNNSVVAYRAIQQRRK